MPGPAPIDKQCAHEASQGIMLAQLMTSTPILEVFVHEDEADDPEVLAEVFEDRCRKHARNAYWMLFEPDQLARRAGTACARASTTPGRSSTRDARRRHRVAPASPRAVWQVARLKGPLVAGRRRVRAGRPTCRLAYARSVGRRSAPGRRRHRAARTP